MSDLKNEILEIKKDVLSANLNLVKHGLVIFTWGNVSGITANRKYMVIKPSGVDYSVMSDDDMVVVDVETGDKIVDDKIGATSQLNPSSDAPTHLELYRKYADIKGVVHTHSTHATAYAQSGSDLIALGTTHADYFHGSVPCTRLLSKEEVENQYELNTGKVIVETFEKMFGDNIISNINEIPGVLVNGHGPFAWGNSPMNAVHNAVILEEIAKMNFLSLSLVDNLNGIPKYVLDKHYNRKHGKNAYYGQGK